MSLDVSLTKTQPCVVYTANVTHNLTKMANEAGIQHHLWNPEEIGISRAFQLIQPLETGLELLRSDPQRFRKYNPENGWGNYEIFVDFVEKYLSACRDHPDAEVKAYP